MSFTRGEKQTSEMMASCKEQTRCRISKREDAHNENRKGRVNQSWDNTEMIKEAQVLVAMENGHAQKQKDRGRHEPLPTYVCMIEGLL